MPEPHPRLSEPYVAEFDSIDPLFPVVGRLVDPREPGYTLPELFSPCPDPRWPNHVFVGVIAAQDDRRVLWQYRLLPGSRTYGYSIDPATGIGTITEAHVVRNGTRGGVDYPTPVLVSSATVTPGASGTLSSATVIAPGTGAVPGASFQPLGGVQTTPAACQILTTQARTAAVSAGGSGYTENDTITGIGGTFTTAATFRPATLGLVGGELGNAGVSLTNVGVLTLNQGGTGSPRADINITAIKMTSIPVNNGGTGYLINDVLLLHGGTHSEQAQVRVDAVSLLSATVNFPGTDIATGDTLTIVNGFVATTCTMLVDSTQVTGAAVDDPGTGVTPGDVLTMTDGTFTTAATLTVTNTQVASVAGITNGGSGGTDGPATVTGTTGTGEKFQANVTISGGVITSVDSIPVPGNYTVNPTNLGAEPVTGAGLTGAELDIVIGALIVAPLAGGDYTVETATSATTGANSDVTLDSITYGVGTFTITNPGTFNVNSPATLTCLDRTATFTGAVYSIAEVVVSTPGSYTIPGGAYTSSPLIGSGAGADFGAALFGALTAFISSAGNYTVTDGTLSAIPSGVTWINASYRVLTVALLNGGSYTANTATMTTASSGTGTGCTLTTITYGLNTVAVTNPGVFTTYPATFTTSGLGGATLAPFWDAAGASGSTVVTVPSTAGLAVGFDVTFTGTNSVPSLDGTHTVTAISGNTFTIGIALLTAPTSGTVQLAAEIHREVQNITKMYAIQGSAQLDVRSLSSAAHTVSTMAPYPFPPKCISIEQFLSRGASSTQPLPGSVFPNPCSIKLSHGTDWNPGVAMKMSAGPDCPIATVIEESYHATNPTISETPLRVFLSVIEAIKISGDYTASQDIHIDESGTNNYTANQIGYGYRFDVDSTPFCLTGTIRDEGSGVPVIGVPAVAIRVTPSVPTTFHKNQTFVAKVDVSRGALGMYRKIVVRQTTPNTGALGYFS